MTDEEDRMRVALDKAALSTVENLRSSFAYVELADRALTEGRVRDDALAASYARLAQVHAIAALACATRDAGMTR